MRRSTRKQKGGSHQPGWALGAGAGPNYGSVNSESESEAENGYQAEYNNGSNTENSRISLVSLPSTGYRSSNSSNATNNSNNWGGPRRNNLLVGSVPSWMKEQILQRRLRAKKARKAERSRRKEQDRRQAIANAFVQMRSRPRPRTIRNWVRRQGALGEIQERLEEQDQRNALAHVRNNASTLTNRSTYGNSNSNYGNRNTNSNTSERSRTRKLRKLYRKPVYVPYIYNSN